MIELLTVLYALAIGATIWALVVLLIWIIERIEAKGRRK